MVDGVKIDVPTLNGAEWFNNPLLDFFTYTSTTTGVVRDKTQIAHYRGLTFIITASHKYSGTFYCSLRGSLHKYYNEGNHNANDFTITQLYEVITDLQNKFQIDPNTAVLRNVEFGVNIHTAQTAQTIIHNLVALYNEPYRDFKIEGVKVGKGIGKYNHTLKIYDKGKQSNIPTKNLMRIEIAVKRMRYLEKYGIHTLADLVNIDKIQPLGDMLVDYWANSIYYDKALKWRELSNYQQKKVLYLATPRNWADFNPMQRMRAKQFFQKITAENGTTSTHTEISNLITEKWHKLTADNCICMHHDFTENGSKELYMIAPLEYTGKTYTKPTNKKSPKKVRKSTIKKHHKKGSKCRTCKTDISHKKANTLYCSKRCNNSYQAKQRKLKRQKLKKSETKALNKLLAQLHRSKLGLWVEYRTHTGTYCDRLLQSEINTFPDWIRKVTRVTIQKTPTPLVLTSHRAKTLIRNINHLNTKQL